MPGYRFYAIKNDGHIGGPPILRDLPDDLIAVQEARKLGGANDVEIWQGARLVAICSVEGEIRNASAAIDDKSE